MPIQGSYQPQSYTGNGITVDFTFSFKIFETGDLGVYLDEVKQSADYSVVWTASGGTVTFTTAPASGVVVFLNREVAYDRTVDYKIGGTLKANGLDDDIDRVVAQVQQLENEGLKVSVGTTKWDATNNRIINVADPVDDQDAATKAWVDTTTAASAASAASSATNAQASAAAALVSEGLADDDATATAADVVTTNADVVKTNADVVTTNADAATTTQDAIDTAADLVATNQDTIDTAADLAATNQDTIDTAADLVATAQDVIDSAANADAALTSANNAATSYDDFDDRYLGSKASNPTLDNDGNALLTGALYWNTTSSELRVYDSAAWVTAAISTAGFYTKTESDANYAPITRGRKNLLRNGNMNVWQRNTTFAPIANTAFSADGWQSVFGGAMVGTITRVVSATTSNKPFQYYWNYDVTTADTSLATTDHSMVMTKVEGIDSIAMRLGEASATEITLSFWHAHSLTGTYSVAFRNADSSRSYIAEYTQSVSDIFEKTTITLTGDTTGTWLYTPHSIGIKISFAFASGSTYTTSTLNTWSSNDYLASTNQVNAMASTSNFCRLAGIQLEVGGEATDYDNRPFSEELERCQRHYEKSYNYNTAEKTATAVGQSAHVIYNVNNSARAVGAHVGFATQKSGTPTITTYTDSGTLNKANDVGAATELSTSIALAGSSGFRWHVTTAAQASADIRCHWTAKSEL